MPPRRPDTKPVGAIPPRPDRNADERRPVAGTSQQRRHLDPRRRLRIGTVLLAVPLAVVGVLILVTAGGKSAPAPSRATQAPRSLEAGAISTPGPEYPSTWTRYVAPSGLFVVTGPGDPTDPERHSVGKGARRYDRYHVEFEIGASGSFTLYWFAYPGAASIPDRTLLRFQAADARRRLGDRIHSLRIDTCSGVPCATFRQVKGGFAFLIGYYVLDGRLVQLAVGLPASPSPTDLDRARQFVESFEPPAEPGPAV